MKKIIRLTERDLTRIVKKVINEETFDEKDPLDKEAQDYFLRYESLYIGDMTKNEIEKILKYRLKDYLNLYQETKLESDKYLMLLRKLQNLLRRY
jgi:hypothetical protein